MIAELQAKGLLPLRYSHPLIYVIAQLVGYLTGDRTSVQAFQTKPWQDRFGHPGVRGEPRSWRPLPMIFACWGSGLAKRWCLPHDLSY